eukprot:762997-Hanusia_phi.AAC.6
MATSAVSFAHRHVLRSLTNNGLRARECWMSVATVVQSLSLVIICLLFGILSCDMDFSSDMQEIAAVFSPRHIMGVDIDPALVQKFNGSQEESSQTGSNDQLDKPDTESANSKQENSKVDDNKPPTQPFRPLSVQSHRGSDVRANRGPVVSNLPDSDTHPFEFPFNCSFRKEDYTEDDDFDCFYDTILCLRRLFDKVYKSLAPGGCFILEIQNVGFASVRSLRVPTGNSEPSLASKAADYDQTISFFRDLKISRSDVMIPKLAPFPSLKCDIDFLGGILSSQSIGMLFRVQKYVKTSSAHLITSDHLFSCPALSQGTLYPCVSGAQKSPISRRAPPHQLTSPRIPTPLLPATVADQARTFGPTCLGVSLVHADAVLRGRLRGRPHRQVDYRTEPFNFINTFQGKMSANGQTTLDNR